ncbi:hypothetical protein MTR_4g027125 [Medicago truncatula]|uniref:Disease resistance protein At4g27190-like leucine-rich repeats domain-containing protein n=1 Tax=Medicago truncatula TaxID=3880 RepID=A0A072UHC8_MEDTR|nr:hypothetical protein MTR_4g027125 [Medicago truncatula]
MKNIRSLLFKHVNLDDISILETLQSLETLDLNHCTIDELPHGITKLEKLKLLNLKDCEIARNNPFEVIEGCSSLEVLYFRGSFNDFCIEITFPKLKSFYINEYSDLANDLSMKFVSFESDDFFLSETTLKYCMQESEGIRLCRIERVWRNIIPEIVPLDQGMNDLAELHLRCILQLKCLIDTTHTESQVSKVFSKLVVLDLNELENLEELFNGPLSFDSLNSLEKLSIKDCKHLQSLFKCNLNLFNLKSVSLEGCPMLISLFQLSTAVSLVSLDRLEIKECGSLEYIIDEGKGEESRGEIIDDNESTSQGSMFKKLEVISIENITISDCKHLKSLFKCNINLFNLKSVSLERCPMLIALFQLSTAVSLLLLERLEIIDCELLENIIIDDNNSTSHAHDLPTLKSIIIKSCDKLNYIFGEDVKLGSLESLEFDGIPNLIDIFP